MGRAGHSIPPPTPQEMVRFHFTSLGSFLMGAAEGSLGLAVGKEKSCSMLEKSGSTTSVQGLLSVAHMELRSTGEGQTRYPAETSP